MLSAIVEYLKKSNIIPVDSENLQQSKDFLYKNFSLIGEPIFEYSYYEVLYYQTYKGPFIFFELENNLISLHIRDKDIHIFASYICNESAISFLVALSKHLGLTNLKLDIMTEKWVQLWHANLISTFGENNVSVTFRAENEAVYDIEKLTTLEGSDFSTLRRVKAKRVSTNEITFYDMTEDNFEHGVEVLNAWHETQGKLYEGPSRYHKELYALQKFSKHKIIDENIFIRIGYFKDNPVSLTLDYINPVIPTWGVNFMIKSKSKKFYPELPHGVADTAYLDIFDQLGKKGVKYLNDGEIGSEEGTRNHKLQRFKPIDFLKSYNVEIKL